ncbi:hypothetical protein FA95DRAFT_1589042 [Auriscalpium vulgare]|uniref:Uncharacterized protein n=1 Tax=Auriscalpium vulgare TaxID=40419 RepID=A0ACB8RUT6_9AGAM|nr:hypothetical protein FA95DRAFT_1589042 [Auriscalpium vulgare]
MSAQPDPAFLALSDSLQSRINRAFAKATSSQRHASTSRAGGFLLDPGPSTAPGGFIVENSAPGGFLLDDDPAPGGFIIDEEEPAGGFLPAAEDADEYIPLSRIPYALQLLDLPPDDEDTIAVFNNAAEGWGTSRRRRWGGEEEEEQEEDDKRVSKRDWQSVCAALLDEPGADEEDDAEQQPDEEDKGAVDDEPIEIDESEGGSSDEYTEVARPKRRQPGRGKDKDTPTKSSRAKRRRTSPSLSPSESGELTTRQKAACLEAFVLFFPGVDANAAAKRRLGVRELAAAAKSLSEKIKTEEIVEMLDAYSTSPDKTLGLAEFERMMVTTRMA